MQHRLGGADGDDQICVDERGVHAGDAVVEAQRPQIVRLAVVDDELATERTRAVGAEQSLELTASRALAEPAGNEDRHTVAREARALELVQHRGERVPPRIVLDGGKRQHARLHHHGRSPGPGDDVIAAPRRRAGSETLRETAAGTSAIGSSGGGTARSCASSGSATSGNREPE